MSASTSDHWTSQQSPPTRLTAAGVVLLLVALAGAFYWLEQDRSRKQVAEAMHVHRNQDGAIDLVRFETDEVTERHWEELRPTASTLHTLHLSRTTSVAGGLAAVGEFANLETLFLLDCAWVDDQQLQHLAGLKLTHLNLEKTPVTDRGLAGIDLSRLRILDLTGCEGITDAGLDRLRDGESLTNVLLEGTSLTLDGFERLRVALPEARLHLGATTLMQTFCKVDGGSPWLETRGQVDTLIRFLRIPHNWRTRTYSPASSDSSLSFKGPAVGPALADILAAVPELNSVSLQQASMPGGFEAASDSVRDITLTELTDEVDLSSLASVKSLEQLEIYSTTIPEGELSFLAELTQLKHLYLGGCQFAVADLQLVGRCESLENLGISSTTLPEGALAFLPELPRLKGLTLYRLQVSEADLLSVAQCESLERIDLRGVAVSDEAGMAISGLPNLQALGFSADKISPELPEKIRSQYPQLQLRAE